jgi:NAD(P)-dependent dehydrogenase (short-subunit alcohol dehydrogenase family)
MITQLTETIKDNALARYAHRVTADSLTGKVAIVTGAGRGLGRCYAYALAAAGSSVVINDADESSAQEAAQEITEAGGRALAVPGKVGPESAANELVEATVNEFGRLDIMVTNAGILRDRVTWKMSEAEFDMVIDTHLKGTWTCGKAAIQQMRTQGEGGKLILIGSPAGQFGSFGQSNYASAKAGIVGLGRTWSMELSRDRIDVNIVIPTAMTAMTATIPTYKEWSDAFAQGVPLPTVARREHALGSPEDVTPLVVWLASNDSDGVTGQALGLGGDRLTLYSHPDALSTADQDGGWSAEALGRAWKEDLSSNAQASGPKQLPDPAENPAASSTDK